ncbi:MAG: aconitase X swivel domain-containing protein [Candidatus Hodarchaeota archaeon]
MSEKSIRGRGLIGGVVEGEALVFNQALGFVGEIDPTTGEVIDARQEAKDQNIANKILIIRNFRGSTAGSGVFLEAVRNKKGPLAFITINSDPILVAGAVLAEKFYNVKIPVVDEIDKSLIKEIMTGDYISVDGNRGVIKIIRRVCRITR